MSIVSCLMDAMLKAVVMCFVSWCPLQCGILQESVFSSSLTEKVRFQVVTSPLQEAMDTGEQLRVVVEGVTLGGLSLELSMCTYWLCCIWRC